MAAGLADDVITAYPSARPGPAGAIHGVGIGPCAGSCGTALYRNEAVIVTDIARDPLWDDYRAYALPHGLAACWSYPIRSADGTAVGTFALYYHEPRNPTREDLEIIRAAARRAGLLLDRAGAGARREELVSDLA